MESSEARINQIIIQYNLLIFHYQHILDQFEVMKTKGKLDFVMENPLPYLKNDNIGHLEKFHLYINYFVFLIHNESIRHYFKSLIPVLFKNKKFHILQEVPDKREGKFLTPVVKYLIKTHIRRQFRNLHRLFLREIIILSPTLSKEKIHELIVADNVLNEYTKQLPDIKRFFVTLSLLILAIIPPIQIFGVDSMITNLMKGNIDIFLGILIGVIMTMAFILADIFSSAFRIKRSKFMGDESSIYPGYDLYFGRGSEIYEKSIYKIENDLYQKLGKSNQKPKEIPVDCILQILLPGGFAIFLTGIVISGIVILFVEKSPLPSGFELVISFLASITFAFFVMPIVKIRRRRKNILF